MSSLLKPPQKLNYHGGLSALAVAIYQSSPLPLLQEPMANRNVTTGLSRFRCATGNVCPVPPNNNPEDLLEPEETDHTQKLFQ